MITFIGVDCYVIKRQQNDAISNISIITPLRPLAWGDVNFIHTTDTHGTLTNHNTIIIAI
jgi:2',3'-cyclic-nucleotide 2'-phosphodiesterase (5'-nucleotidase family)